jgi:hypothetical protein
MAVAPTIDFDAVFKTITDRVKDELDERLFPPLVELYDGDWNLRGVCNNENSAKFQVLKNETGTAEIELPLDYYLSEWLADVDERQGTNVHLRMEHSGARWTGRMAQLKVVKGADGRKVLRAIFKHDYEELKHILVWSNPFLPAELQFPKMWVIFGKARWALKTTLLCQLMRLESSLWMLPANPMDLAQWFNFDTSTWWNVVKPDLTPDNSVGAVVHSRFKTMHDTSKRIADDAQLVWEPRRFLRGDPPPWPGANLRHGCLVWDLVDKSGWNTGTSFNGNIFSGLVRELINIAGDGISESVEQVANPNVPGEYITPGYRGTVPSMPGVVFYEGECTGISSSEWTHSPATVGRITGGGHSAPGINEGIEAAVAMVGDLTALIPAVGVPMGGVANAVLKPLYTDVFGAFGTHENHDRVARLGKNHYLEDWADGGDRAYTLGWVLAMRGAMYKTREINRVTLTVEDNSPYRIGDNGYGDFFLGDRVAFNVEGMPIGKLYVECVSELTLSWDRSKAPTWEIQIGQREPSDPLMKAFELWQEYAGILRDLGVL